MTPYEQAERELRLRGVILTKLPGQFQVALGRAEVTCELLEEAVVAGRRMAAEKPPETSHGARRKRPLSMRPRARIRRAIKSHNRRLRWATTRGST
jgi:hypothetical protein